jgi:hypothetical protein
MFRGDTRRATRSAYWTDNRMDRRRSFINEKLGTPQAFSQPGAPVLGL